MSLSIAKLSAHIVGSGKSVLFLDTCALLDVVRSPIRQSPLIVDAAMEVSAAQADTNSAYTVVLPSLFSQEWADNVESEFRALVHFMAETETRLQTLSQIYASLSLSATPSPSIVHGPPLYVALAQLCNRIMDQSHVIKSSAAIAGRASRRTIAPRRPAQKGGGLKDCIIFEELLALARTLRGKGFSKNIVFATSNTNDYHDLKRKPHADIFVDIEPLRIVLTTSLNWARHEVEK